MWKIVGGVAGAWLFGRKLGGGILGYGVAVGAGVLGASVLKGMVSPKPEPDVKEPIPVNVVPSYERQAIVAELRKANPEYSAKIDAERGATLDANGPQL